MFARNFRTWKRNWQVCNELGTRALKSDLKSTIIIFIPCRNLTFGLRSLLWNTNKDLLTMTERKPRDRFASIALAVKQQLERFKLEARFGK
jgi:hypothetical protein